MMCVYVCVCVGGVMYSTVVGWEIPSLLQGSLGLKGTICYYAPLSFESFAHG
jgi:hypothetical protein